MSLIGSFIAYKTMAPPCPPVPKLPAPPPPFTESILSSLDFVTFSVMSISALLTIYFLYICYQFTCSHRNREIGGGSQWRWRVVPPPPADFSGGQERAVGPPSTKTAVVTRLFLYGKGGMDGKNADCTICLEEFTEDEVCWMLVNCKHVFHGSCIDKWILNQRHCPLCRTSVLVPVIYPSPDF